MTTKISSNKTSRASLLAVLAAITLIGCGEPPAFDRPMDTATRALMYNGHDYLFIRSAKTWAQAKASCEALGYGLVTINDANEESWLQSFEGSSGWWWIGYTDQQTETVWSWVAGTSSYSNWYPGRPYHSSTEDCAVDNYSAGRWIDANCSALLYYICESLL